MNIREATIDLHNAVEATPFAIRMINGTLSKKDYVRYLNAQYLIFNAMEQYGEYTLPHENLPRKQAIIDDLASLGEEADGHNMPKSAYRYADYILGPYDSEENLRSSHIYLNYMGMMFGGGIVAKNGYSDGNLYKFEGGRSEIIASIRGLELSVDEVNQGFRYHIEIFEELERMGKDD
jgi:heme oxygenase